MGVLKSYFAPYLAQLKPITENKFPIKVHLTFYTFLENGDWDLDNHSWIYCKAIQDALKDAGIIPDDCVQYIRGAWFDFEEVHSDAERKIEVNIYKKLN